MCGGLAVLLGPPSVGGCCYLTWKRGRDAWLVGAHVPKAGATANIASVVSMVGAYIVQRSTVVRLFDEGGSLALDWKKGTETLGEPLKIKTWTHFYKAAGPPVFARVAALVAAFYISGCVHGYVANAADPPPPPPVTTKRQAGQPKAGAKGAKAPSVAPVAERKVPRSDYC